MSRLQRIRKQAMSLRGGIAVAGALAAAVSLTQVAGTMAAPDLEWTAKVPIATANYYPTPLTASVTCETTYTGLLPGRRAKVSWEAVPGATGYRVDLVHSNTGEVKSEFVPAPTARCSRPVFDCVSGGQLGLFDPGSDDQWPSNVLWVYDCP